MSSSILTLPYDVLPKAIVFDLDGTLVDTAPDLSAALNHVLALEGRGPVDEGEVRHMVGHGARALIVRGMAATGKAARDNDIARLLPLFLDFYGRNLATASRPFDGVPELLAALDARGVGLGVCTNKPEGLAVRLLQDVGLARFLGAVVGGDSLPVCKPDPAPFTATLERMGRAGAKAVMVGDSRTDVDTARAVGVPVICVSFGYTDVPVTTLNPDIIIDHYGEFAGALTTLMKT
ncbi:MAG: phosphoglycolate phosphatase [Sphingomonadales bacterium]